ncbi:MAG: hypothetical protein ACI92S_000570, partial [Planctomycetaceae bacterium]
FERRETDVVPAFLPGELRRCGFGDLRKSQSIDPAVGGQTRSLRCSFWQTFLANTMSVIGQPADELTNCQLPDST